MSLRQDPLDELSIPSGTVVEEHDLVTDGDVLVGGQSTVEFGVRGRSVAAGERSSFGGHIEAENDCRLDMWTDVDGDVLVGEDAYLGERTRIGGQLMVSGDLDIGDDVDIEEGFEANGWITIRNPMPTLVFYFIVLSQLLRLGEEEAADDLAYALADGGEAEQAPLVIPRGSSVSDDAWRVSTPASIGTDCRLHGNVRATEVSVDERSELFGSIRARGDVHLHSGSVIHGDVTTRDGAVTIEAGANVRGDISSVDLRVHEHANVEGTMRADGEIQLVQSDADGAVGENPQEHTPNF
ncbi:polymer-forming cytoskeletal protein [Halolamina litorea]|uniref:Polymer-forming cytoskeletal protein n=1 Tax=Halolamina litorea TaxID=1515593 RepID=A0ABD6BTR6_9EURY|nr:polymer-forming cytoskeletal protein [Halolamina litorea]